MANGTAGSTAELSGTRSDSASDHDRYVSQQIERVQRQVKSNELGLAVLGMMVVTLAYLLTLTLIDHWVVGLGVGARTISMIVLFGGLVVFCLLRLIPVLLKSINPIFAAKTLEDAAPESRNSLINFLLLRSQRAEVKPIVFQAVERRAAVDLSQVSVDTAVDRTWLIRLGYALAALVVFAGLYKILSPKDPLASVARIVAPWRDIARPSRVDIVRIEPGNTSIYRGESLPITAVVEGVRNDDGVRLIYSTADGQIIDTVVDMAPHSDGVTYHTTLGGASGMQQVTTYQILAGDAQSHEYKIEVKEAPHILVRRVEYDFPAYTGLESESSDDGDISALEGTKVTIVAEANQPIRSAFVELFEPNADAAEPTDKLTVRSLRMSHRDQEAQIKFSVALQADRKTPNFSGYQLVFSNADGDKNKDPVKHVIDVKPDLAPLVEMLAPKERSVELPEDGSIDFEVRAVDPDFKLQKLTMEGVSAGSSVLKAALIKEPQSGQVIRKFTIRPNQLGLRNGDTAVVWATAEDNRQTIGRVGDAANQSQTSKYRIRVIEPEPAENETAGDEGQPRSEKQNESNESNESNEPGEDAKENQDSPDSGDPSEDKNQTGSESAQSTDPSNEDSESNEKGQGTEDTNSDNENQQPSESKDQESKDQESEDQESKGSETSQNQDPETGSQAKDGSRGEPNQGQTPVESDGSDDGEAIERILDHMEEDEKNKLQQQTSKDESSTPKKPNDGVDKEPQPSASDKPNESDRNSNAEQTNPNNDEKAQQQDDSSNRKSDKQKSNATESETKEKSPTDSDPSEPTKQNEAADQQKDETGTSNNEPKSDHDGKQNDALKPEPAKDGSQPKNQDRPEDKTNADPKQSKPSDPDSDADANNKPPKDENGDPSTAEKNSNNKDDNNQSQSPEKGEPKKKDRSNANDDSKDESNAKDDSKAQPSPTNNHENSDNQDPSGNNSDSDQQGKTPKEENPKSDGTNKPPKGDRQTESNATGQADSSEDAKHEADKANLDYATKATDMALEHLRDQKDNRDLLDKLGWSKKEAESFLKRWEKMSKDAKQSGTPGAKGKRELDETLRSLGLRSPDDPRFRRDVKVRKDANPQASDTGRRSQPPASYREQLRAYLKGVPKSDSK